jgi:hypothetical protein
MITNLFLSLPMEIKVLIMLAVFLMLFELLRKL